MPEPTETVRPLSMRWFKPLWRRLVLLGILVAWVGFEWLYSHDQWWQWITLAALAYGVWIFILNFENELAKEDNAKPKS